MIPWTDMDERERAVWSATVGAAMVERESVYGIREDERQKFFEEAAELADLAVDAMREYLKGWPPIGKKP